MGTALTFLIRSYHDSQIDARHAINLVRDEEPPQSGQQFDASIDAYEGKG